MGDLGGSPGNGWTARPKGDSIDRVSVLRYSERRVLGPHVATMNKLVRGTWVEALDMGGLGGPKRIISC
jgi:hypothetical protein